MKYYGQNGSYQEFREVFNAFDFDESKRMHFEEFLELYKSAESGTIDMYLQNY
jgi:Ca2+-binding EF-hand superfamily protein